MEAAFSHLTRIRTIRASALALAAIGFGLFTVPVLASFFLREHYGLGVVRAGRAWPRSAAWPCSSRCRS